jgi:hypothetical protein
MVPGRGHNKENHIYLCLYKRNLPLQNQLANFNQTWYTLSLGHGNSKLFKLRTGPLQRGDNYKNAKIGWGHLKIFFSRTTAPEELIFT